MTLSIFDPSQVIAPPRPYRGKRPRCQCGCGKAAFWPRDGEPVFHTRLCGYLMALKMVRKRAKGAKR